MKILLFLFVFTFATLGINAQQQGFGCINDKKVISFSGINTVSNTAKPTVKTPPIFGKKARKNGCNLPLPFGVGIYSMYYDQGYTASNLRLIPDSSALVARAD